MQLKCSGFETSLMVTGNLDSVKKFVLYIASMDTGYSTADKVDNNELHLLAPVSYDDISYHGNIFSTELFFKTSTGVLKTLSYFLEDLGCGDLLNVSKELDLVLEFFIQDAFKTHQQHILIAFGNTLLDSKSIYYEKLCDEISELVAHGGFVIDYCKHYKFFNTDGTKSACTNFKAVSTIVFAK